MKVCLLGLLLWAGGGLTGCSAPGGTAIDAAVDLAAPLCASIHPADDHPSGTCVAGQICVHEPPEGWSCSCSTALLWNCNYIGMVPDMAH